MRLWHYELLSKLSKQRLQGQHRECCALRGLGWGKKHATVNYVFDHPYGTLFYYHVQVITILIVKHNVAVDNIWLNPFYRGKRICFDATVNLTEQHNYPEHNKKYLKECLSNLFQKKEKIIMEDCNEVVSRKAF